MVGRLVWLKWRLLVNGVRADRQRAFGLPIVTIGVAAIGFWLAGKYGRTAGDMPAEAAGEFTLWVMLVAWLTWTTLPVLLFPLDETLDPARFSLAPMSRIQLMAGLTAAGLVTPTIVVPVLVLATNVGLFSGPLTALMALAAGLLILLHLIVGGQTFTALVSLVLRSRRGRDLAVVIVSSLGLFGFALQQTIATAVGEYGLAGAVEVYSLSSWWWALPPVAAQQAAVAASAGSWGQAILALAVSAGWLLVIISLWNRLLHRLVTTPESSPLRSSKRVRPTLADRPGWSTTLVVARKELLFYVRDPRLRMVWTGAVIFLGVIVATLLLGTTQLSDIQRAQWLPLIGPMVVIFIGLPVALNQFGWERNAASFLFALPAGPRQLLIGKNLAAGAALLVETLMLSIILAWVGEWRLGDPGHGAAAGPHRHRLPARHRKHRLGPRPTPIARHGYRPFCPGHRTGLPGDYRSDGFLLRHRPIDDPPGQRLCTRRRVRPEPEPDRRLRGISGLRRHHLLHRAMDRRPGASETGPRDGRNGADGVRPTSSALFSVLSSQSSVSWRVPKSFSSPLSSYSSTPHTRPEGGDSGLWREEADTRVRWPIRLRWSETSGNRLGCFDRTPRRYLSESTWPISSSAESTRIARPWGRPW